jgi:hypothetical protein
MDGDVNAMVMDGLVTQSPYAAADADGFSPVPVIIL